jgi:glycosyltransferase involved in cell wall biosynthesis
MAAGVPWVAFGVGAIYTMSGGVIVQSESEMAKMVSKLLSDRTWRLELGRVGRRAIEESHSWSMIADKYLSCMTT